MSDKQVLLADLFAGLETDNIDIDQSVETVVCLIKARGADEQYSWVLRTAGEKLSSEEILGTLSGLHESIRAGLISDSE